MTALVWANFPLALLFVAAFAGIPLWMTFKHPRTEPDFSEARAYLRAKEAFARTGAEQPGGLTTARRHAGAGRPVVPGRRHATGAAARHGHPASDRRHSDASV